MLTDPLVQQRKLEYINFGKLNIEFRISRVFSRYTQRYGQESLSISMGTLHALPTTKTNRNSGVVKFLILGILDGRRLAKWEEIDYGNHALGLY